MVGPMKVTNEPADRHDSEPNWHDDFDATESGWRYADPDQLLGALQAGHGVGALRALKDPGAACLVHACIRTDHRWWQLIDEREVYLARLVRDLRMDIAPIVRWLWTRDRAVSWTEQGAGFELAAGVLEALARAGNAEAQAQLLRYVHTGRRWPHVLQLIATRWPIERWAGLRDRVSERLSEDVYDPLWFGDEPWRTWAPGNQYSDRTADRFHPSCAARTAAGGVLPTGPDGVSLSDLLVMWKRKMHTCDWCGFVPLADAIAQRGPAAREALPALRALWKLTPHSAERAAVLRAMLTIDPAGSRRTLAQGLWDCESGVRLLSAKHVPLGRRTEARLSALCRDPLENAEVRRVAADRLAGARSRQLDG
ncbi:hypothetical protein [Kitasatospora sp. NBC_01266]|uniref:hypothetical protein n=1 Tax=Kitasatospora sp. NBC_01266 TaxID=2903572 RepID=UPI002E328524|nr:hypothetical protein [Kitasatospora sp. NBC_01266]